MIGTPTPIIPETAADIGADPAGTADAVQSNLDAHAANTTTAHGIDAIVSTLATKADQAVVDLKAPLASPALTGTPQAPTADPADDSTKLATTAFVQSVIRALVNLAPADLDTLKEIADRLQGDETTAAALAATVAGKLSKSANLSDLADPAASRGNLGLGSAATHAASDFDAAGAAAAVTKASIGLGNVTNDKQLPLAGGTMLGDLDLSAEHVLRFGDGDRFVGYSADYGGLLLQDPSLFRFQCSASGLGATLDEGNLSVDGQVTGASMFSYGAVSGSVFNGALSAANLTGTISTARLPDLSASYVSLTAASGLIPSAGWQPGRVYTCLAASGTTSSVNKAAGIVEYCPIYLPKGAQIVGMYLWISTAAGAGKRARLGIYSNVGGEPGTRLVDAGYVAIDATGTPGIAISWSVPAAGLYWAAVLYEDVVGLHCFTQLPGLMGSKNIALAGGLACVYANGQTFGPLPSTAPAVSYANSYTPGIYLFT